MSILYTLDPYSPNAAITISVARNSLTILNEPCNTSPNILYAEMSPVEHSYLRINISNHATTSTSPKALRQAHHPRYVSFRAKCDYISSPPTQWSVSALHLTQILATVRGLERRWKARTTILAGGAGLFRFTPAFVSHGRNEPLVPGIYGSYDSAGDLRGVRSLMRRGCEGGVLLMQSITAGSRDCHRGCFRLGPGKTELRALFRKFI